MNNSIFMSLLSFACIAAGQSTNNSILACGVYGKPCSTCTEPVKRIKFYQYINSSTRSISDPTTIQNSQSDIFFIVHGWCTSYTYDKNIAIADVLVKLDYFVVLVDYAYYGNQSYACAPSIVECVSKEIMAFLQLISNKLSQVRIVGHSLGAHVAAVAVRNLTNPQVSRLSALDPAGPFTACPALPARLQLQSTDANYVDVLHTSIVFGSATTCGTITFYAVLCGTPFVPGQAYCIDNASNDPNIEGCNHVIALDYFRISLTSNNYTAMPCYMCNGQQTTYNYAALDAGTLQGSYCMTVTKDKMHTQQPICFFNIVSGVCSCS